MNHDPLAIVVSALEARGCRPKERCQGEWSARCPAHDGKGHTSLSVTAGTDGRALLHCFSGCPPAAVTSALGLKMHDLFATDPTCRQTQAGSRRKGAAAPSTVTAESKRSTKRKVYDSWQAALPKRFGAPSTAWKYFDADGTVVSVVARWDRLAGDKEIRPVTAAPGGGWVAEAPPVPRPIYNLPEVAKADRVVVVEGEKCAAALVSLGITATTSSQGSKSAATADWNPLAGKNIVILPDHDEAGESYARDVARLAAEADAASVAVVRLANDWTECPAGGDVADWIESRGDAAEPDDIRAALEALIAKAEPVAAEAIEEAENRDDLTWAPFPTDQLPEPLRSFVTEGAAALGVDESMVALPLLAMVAGAIGNSRRLRIKPQWSVPPVLWTAVVSDSGSGKSPSLKMVTQFTDAAQTKAFLRHDVELADYEERMQEYEIAIKRAVSRGGPRPEKPDKPAARRFAVNDTTVEALVPILRDNPRGVVLVADELAGWFASHDAYRPGGRAGVDRPKWLSMYDAREVTVDRKTSGTIHVPSAAVSITGGVQPAILRSLLTPDNVTSGLVSRFIFSMPPRRAMLWTDEAVSFALMAEVSDLVTVLLDGLAIAKGSDDPPKCLDLAPDAKDEFRRFGQDVYAQQADASGAAAAMLSKLTATAARLALVIHMARSASREPALGDRVDIESVRRGIAIACWAGREQQRIYSLLLPSCGVDQDADDATRLGRWLATRPEGFASDRDIRHGLKCFREDGSRADAAAARLVAEGRAVRERINTGGRPAKGLRLVRGAFGVGGAVA